MDFAGFDAGGAYAFTPYGGQVAIRAVNADGPSVSSNAVWIDAF